MDACSNRSASLLKLQKVNKALEDAEACILIKPDWEKGASLSDCQPCPLALSNTVAQTADGAAGYYRKGAALEAQERFDEVCPNFDSLGDVSPSRASLTSKPSAGC